MTILGTSFWVVLTVVLGIVWLGKSIVVYDYRGGVITPEEARWLAAVGWAAVALLPVALASLLAQVLASVKRLRDMGSSVFWLLLLLWPLTGIFLCLLLCFLPSNCCRRR